MERARRRLSLLIALLVPACTDDAPSMPGTESESSGTSSGSTEGADTTGTTDGGSTDDDGSSSSGGEVPPSPSPDWCDRVVAGPAGDAAILDLSLAHAAIRFFGTEADYPTVDAALADALAVADALDTLDLTDYDEALDSVCIIPAASAGELGPTSVDMIGTTAWVRPGIGEVVLPPETQVMVLDLRDLPNVPELAELLPAAVSPALATEVSRPTRQVRRHVGHTDQYFSPQNVYFTDEAELTPPPLEPTGSADLELVVVTGERLAPAAAELAGSLRLQERAWLVGHDVLAEVAESSWRPIGDAGAAWRSSDLLEWGTARWPGTIVADILTNAPEDAIAERFPAGPPPPPSYEDGARSSIGQYDPWSATYDSAVGLGEIRSALMVSHGTVELFFPYFDVVGHETDDALLELLAETTPADAGNRALMEERLRRFSSVLHDGHAFVYDLQAPVAQGVIAARFEALDGYPVVRRANHAGLQPGDTIIAIAGEPTLAWYAARYPLVSAASDGYRHDLVTRMLTALEDPIELTIRSALGVEQTLDIDPVLNPANVALGYAPINRASGWLDDLGSPGIYYINMSNTSDMGLNAAIDDAIATPATGMVVDMRGYPNGNHYAIAERLIPGAFDSPIFETPILTGPDMFEEQLDVYALDGTDAYAGPMVLLVGNHSVSAAENFSIMLVGAERVTVVGQQSASTNGNISGIALPGAFVLAFTGLRVLFPDGSTFHGVGIVPDVEVVPDPAAYAQGDDPELLAAIAVLAP
jgi:C-terminal processing protease CtpA/Prc